MVRFLHLRFADYLRKYAVFTLACSWISGLILGISISKSVSVEVPASIAASPNASPYGVVMVTLFPILVSVLLMYMSQNWLIPVIAFFKSFSFSYVSWILMRDFGSASWLIQFLMMFSDCVSLPLLWWFWCRSLKADKPFSFALSAPLVFTAVAIAILDYRFISPILSSLQIS